MIGETEALAQDRLRLLVEAVRDYAIVGLDEAGRVTSWNAGAEALTGHPAAGALGRPFGPLTGVGRPADVAGAAAAELAAARSAGRFEGEGWCARADGGRFWAHRVVTALRLDGRLIGYSVILRDTSERQRLEEQRVEREAWRRAAVLKGQFLGTVSHELRTPINAIMGFGSLLADGVAGPLSPRQDEFVGKVMGGAEAMLDLVNDLIEMAQAQAGPLPLDRQACDLAALAARELDHHRAAAERREVRLVLVAEVGLPALAVDAWRIARVVRKLVDNAVKFSPAGGEVVVRLVRAGDVLRLDVTDTGPGVPRAAMRRIFDAFTQADQSHTRAHGGSGLSLALCHAILVAHGGTIGVARPRVGGARFWFTLPAADQR